MNAAKLYKNDAEANARQAKQLAKLLEESLARADQLDKQLTQSQNDAQKAQEAFRTTFDDLNRAYDDLDATRGQLFRSQVDRSGSKKKDAADIFQIIIHDVRDAYKKKWKQLAEQKNQLEIIQLNIERSTYRLLCFSKDSWYYDDNRFPIQCPLTRLPAKWILIKDELAVRNLNSLICHETSEPIEGRSVLYDVSHITYMAKVCDLYLMADRTQPTLLNRMLFEGSFFKFPSGYIQHFLDAYTFERNDEDMKSAEVADLAELWSSYASGFKYDKKRCELWVKRTWLLVWLRTALERGYDECCITMHGMRTQQYDLLKKDSSGFNMSMSLEGKEGFGFYASYSDRIASKYDAMNLRTRLLPKGSGVLALTLVNRERESRRKDGNGILECAAAYKRFYLDGHGPERCCNNAVVYYDQKLFLIFGLAVACSDAS